MAEFRPQEILRVLTDHEVRFIIIGGLAGAFHNVGWVTEDLDIVIDGAEENLANLAAALEEIDARFVMLNPEQIIRPTLDRIRTLHGPMLLNTKHGRLDAVGLCYPISDGPATTELSRAFAEAGICSAERHGEDVKLVGVVGSMRVRSVAMQLLRATMVACRGVLGRESAENMQRHVQAWLDELCGGGEPLLRCGTCAVERWEVVGVAPRVTFRLDVEVARWPGLPVRVGGSISTE